MADFPAGNTAGRCRVLLNHNGGFAMIENLQDSTIAIIGGGRFCKIFLEYLCDRNFMDHSPPVLGVADINPHAEGLLFARRMGIFTTQDYRQLYTLENLQVLIEMTGDPSLSDTIKKTKPAGVELIDQIEARAIWSTLQLEREKRQALKELKQHEALTPGILARFETFADRLAQVIIKRNEHYLKIERELIEGERTLSQIIQGSTMPTFVIDKDHIVTHWNKALERLSGTAAEEIVGTNRQWAPFWEKERPTMADLILVGADEKTIRDLYGSSWHKSVLIEGAYEAEVFFPNLGTDGKWCWFTAAPIKAPDGTIIGAIETLWDKTEEKNTVQVRARHTRLLTETARALAESERTMTQIIQGSTIPTFVINENHLVTHWNRALERLTGYSADEMVGTCKQWKPFYHNERPTMADVILDQVDEDQIRKLYGTKWRRSSLIEGAYEAEDFFPHFGDNGKWIWFTASPIKSPNGRFAGAIETLWDKTEDINAEEERERRTKELSALCSIFTSLNTAEKFDAGVFKAIQIMMAFLGADGICIYMKDSDGKYRLRYGYGFSEEACYRVRVLDDDSIIHQVAQSNQFTLYENLPAGSSDEISFIEENKLISLAYIPIHAEEKKTFGVIRIGSQKAGHFTDDQKDVLTLIGNQIGIAIENAILQEQYIKSEEKYRTLFNFDPHPTFILDIQAHRIQDINQRALDNYGYSREEMLGLHFLELGDRDEELAQALQNISLGKSLLFVKRKHYRKGHRPFFVNINISDAKYGEREVVIASTTDITESVEKEAQLIQASKLTTLGQMAAGIAHEINQPLNVIQVCADFFLKMIARGQPIGEDDLRSMATDIGKNVQRAAAIIQHMRDFARQSSAARNKIYINDPIHDVFKVLGHQLRVHQIELVLDLDPHIPPIMADHNRLEQVFINLVTNAVDAMDEKHDRPEYDNAQKTLTIKSFAENGFVSVTVSDTGIGMSDEVMAKLFEPFFTTKDVGKGTGLGVCISYGIVKDYEGTIDIASKIGEGTTFKLKFPALRQP
jgi:PAS domain S-box-containing protein